MKGKKMSTQLPIRYQPAFKSLGSPTFKPSARRFTRTVVIVAIAAASVLGFLSSGLSNVANANSSALASAPASFNYVTISGGETLWALAEELAPGTNPQDWIQDVVNLNGLTSTDLVPGQRIALPN